MGNIPKNTVNYFPHYIGKGRKIQMIEQRYGNDGYATWFKILEILCETPFHYLDISDETEKMLLASRCRITNNLLDDILSDLSILGEIDKKFLSVGVIWSFRFVQSIRFVYEKRKNDCLTRKEIEETLKKHGKFKESEPIPEEKTKRFVKPTIEEVHAYCLERGNSVSAEQFVDFYSSKDWKIGKNKMKDWKAAVRTWETPKQLSTSTTVKQTSNNSGDTNNWH